MMLLTFGSIALFDIIMASSNVGPLSAAKCYLTLFLDSSDAGLGENKLTHEVEFSKEYL